MVEVVLELGSSGLSSWCVFPHPQILNPKLGLFTINLITKATTKPAPTGSISIGSSKAQRTIEERDRGIRASGCSKVVT